MATTSNPVVREILRQGRTRKRRYVKAALETGRVESNFTNPTGGDADSGGWRQERASLYSDPTNVRASVRRFFDEAKALDRGQSAARLAADVQRPAAQYRGRYREVRGEAEQILRAAGRGTAGATGTSVFTPGRVDLQRTSQFDQQGFQQAEQRAKVGAFLARRHGTGGILFKSGLLSTTAPTQADFTTSRLQSTVIPGRMSDGAAAAPASGQVGKAVHAARKKLGVRESAGSNRGPEIDRMEKRFGMIGQPYCGIFVGTVLQKAGVKGVTSRVASVQAIEEDAKQGTNGFRSWHSARDARRGDALVTASGRHVVFVTGRTRDGKIKTISANTGNGAIERRVYDPRQVHGAARPRYRQG